MNNPPLGICFPVKFTRTRDGDTPEFRMRLGMRIAVRMIGVDAPEKDEEGYVKATEDLVKKLKRAKEIKLFVPLAPAGKDGILDIIDILRAISFDRVPAHVFADGELVQ